MLKTIYLTIGLLIAVCTVRAQDPAIQRTLEDLMESMETETDENVNYELILDDLTYLGQHPLSINQVTKEEMQRLHLMTDRQIDDLIAFKEKTGLIYSIYEMAAIEGFTTDLVQKLEPFISFEIDDPAIKNKKSKNEIMGRSTRTFTNSEEGIKNPNYEGSMERQYIRFKHTASDVEYGITAEKDPGETFFKGSNKQGFDYMGAYGNFRIGTGGLRLFVGNYRVSFGQGLVANQGFSMGKSTEPTQVFRFGQGIRSSASTDGNQFFRGIASQMKLGPITLMPFVSYRQLDARIDTLEGNPYFGAIQTSGYHRTKSEIASKNALEQLVGGGYAVFAYQRWTIGFTAVFTRFNALMNRSDEPSNRFLWEGRENFVAAMDWKGSVKNVFYFGEAAISPNKGKALLAGILFKPVSNAEVSAVYRTINKTYFSFFSGAFTESSRANDEQGLYIGFKWFPAPRWTLRSYADFFAYRWIKYTTAAPSNGTEFGTQLSFRASSRTEFDLRIFQEEKKVKVIIGNYKYNEPQIINRVRINFSQKINEYIGLKSRIEWSLYSKLTDEKGMLVYQDVHYKPLGKRFSINGRLAYFKTDGYDSKLYAYENDLLYSFSVPALYGKGIRTYLNVRQSLSEQWSLWLKLAATHRFPATGTENKGESETRSELKVQLRYQF